MKTVLTALIIDDEQLAINRLRRLLEKHSEFIRVTGEAKNGEEGLHLINASSPDVIFLDVEMPKMNGFQLLAKLSRQPKVVFTTAFEHYAIKAFEENSMDYLLKPIEAERLDKTIDKLKQLQNRQYAIPEKLLSLLNEEPDKKKLKSIPVKIGDRTLLLKFEQIQYFEAKEKYVFITSDEGKEYLTDFTIAELENKLDPTVFTRVHRAFIVNKEKIKEIHNGFNSTYIIVMKNPTTTKIHSGRSYLDNVKALMAF